MRKFYAFAVLLAFASLCTSCIKEDSNDPNDDNNPLPGTSWTRTVKDAQDVEFDVRLNFTTGGVMEFVLLEQVEGHEDSHADYAVEGEVITLTNDTGCPDEPTAKYTFLIAGDNLILTRSEDDCDGRIIAIEGTWMEYEE